MRPTGSELLELLRMLYRSTDELVTCDDLDDPCGESEDCDPVEICERIAAEDSITLRFPGEFDYVEWPIEVFVQEAKECESLLPGKLVSLRTPTLALQIVSPASDLAHAVVYHRESLLTRTEDGVLIQLLSQSLPIGVFAAKDRAYADDAWGAVTGYHAVELDFSKSKATRSEELESSLIDAYLFELAASHGIVFERTGFVYDADSEPWWAGEDGVDFKLRPLERSNEGIRLFLAAAQVSDPELRFFSFYKVLEHFAPTVLNIQVHDTLEKKLLTAQALAPSGEFIRDILKIAKSFDQRRNDRDLIKGVLLSGVDLVSQSEFLPKSLRRPISYESSDKEVEQLAKELAEAICATRHQVAHAKAQYEIRGTECEQKDLPKFTEFVERAAADVVRWYNRLPDHQRT